MPPLVSIMIPTYKQANVISNAIESALAQDYPTLEVIVADDNSPDNTQQVVAEYLSDTRLRYIKNPTNLGRVKNYENTLKQHVKGEWVVNLDGDDYYCNYTFISQCIDLIRKYAEEEIVFVQGGKIKQKRNRRELSLPSIKESHKLLDGVDYFLRFPANRNFSHMSTLYNRHIALSLDFYRYDIASADLESFLRLALHGKVILIKQAFGMWIEHESNASNEIDFTTQDNNITYIGSVGQYAREIGLNTKLVIKWQKEMTQGYYYSLLLKVCSNKGLFTLIAYIITLFPKKPNTIIKILLNISFTKDVFLTMLRA